MRPLLPCSRAWAEWKPELLLLRAEAVPLCVGYGLFISYGIKHIQAAGSAGGEEGT